MAAPNDNDSDPGKTQPTETTAPLTPPPSHAKDTVPDASIETAAILHRLMQGARRMPPPEELRKESAKSDGEMFAAYSARGS